MSELPFFGKFSRIFLFLIEAFDFRSENFHFLIETLDFKTETFDFGIEPFQGFMLKKVIYRGIGGEGSTITQKSRAPILRICSCLIGINGIL